MTPLSHTVPIGASPAPSLHPHPLHFGEPELPTRSPRFFPFSAVAMKELPR